MDTLFVCPPRITDEAANGRFVFRELYFPSDGAASVKAGNIGRFVAEEISAGAFRRTRVALADVQ